MKNVLVCWNCKNGYIKNKTPGRIAPWQTRKFCSSKCQASYKQKEIGSNKYKEFTTLVNKLDDGKTPIAKLLSDSIKNKSVSVGTRLSIKIPIGANPAFVSTNMEGKFHSGKYEIGGKEIYFRSRWEANVALYLEFLKKNKEIKEWGYETRFFEFDKIRHGTTRYLPDFEITNNDDTIEFWEVKGYFDSRSKTKLKRMKKYYPEVKLILVDKDFYNDLVKKMGKSLHFY